MLTVKATKMLLPAHDHVTGGSCDHVQLLEILDFQRQVVAGTNFKLKLRLRTKSGSNCSETEEKVCENIVVFRPLPFACDKTLNPDNEECLQLNRPEEIVCS